MNITNKIVYSTWYLTIKQTLSQGISKKEIFLAAMVGSLVGIMPVFGFATILSTVLAIKLRLNVSITVLFSYIVTPIHPLLFLPFIYLGEKIYGIKHTLLTFQAIQDSFQLDYIETFKNLWLELLCGMSGWFIVTLPLIMMIGILQYTHSRKPLVPTL